MIIRKRKRCRKLEKKRLTYNEYIKIRYRHLDKIIERKKIMREIVDIDIFTIYRITFDCYDDLTILEIPLRTFFKWLNTAKYFYNNPEEFRKSFYCVHCYVYKGILHNEYCTRLNNFFFSEEELEHIDEIVKKRRNEIELKNETIK